MKLSKRTPNSADFLRILRKSAGDKYAKIISRRLAQNTQKIRRDPFGIEVGFNQFKNHWSKETEWVSAENFPNFDSLIFGRNHNNLPNLPFSDTLLNL